VPAVYHPKLIKKHATEKDPWGLGTQDELCRRRRYKSQLEAGSEVVYERNEDWNPVRLPKIRRLIWRIIPSAGNRRALIERGDADLSFDLPEQGPR